MFTQLVVPSFFFLAAVNGAALPVRRGVEARDLGSDLAGLLSGNSTGLSNIASDIIAALPSDIAGPASSLLADLGPLLGGQAPAPAPIPPAVSNPTLATVTLPSPTTASPPADATPAPTAPAASKRDLGTDLTGLLSGNVNSTELSNLANDVIAVLPSELAGPASSLLAQFGPLLGLAPTAAATPTGAVSTPAPTLVALTPTNAVPAPTDAPTPAAKRDLGSDLGALLSGNVNSTEILNLANDVIAILPSDIAAPAASLLSEVAPLLGGAASAAPTPSVSSTPSNSVSATITLPTSTAAPARREAMLEARAKKSAAVTSRVVFSKTALAGIAVVGSVLLGSLAAL